MCLAHFFTFCKWFIWGTYRFLGIFISFRSPSNSKTGNIVPARIPSLRLSSKESDTIPTSAGPPEHPKSPPRARRANIAVPPFGMAAAALLKLPGHMIPTESPQRAQDIRLNCGSGNSAIPR